MLKLYKTIIKGNVGQNVNIYVDFSKLDNFLITIITYLFSFFTLFFLLLLLLKPFLSRKRGPTQSGVGSTIFSSLRLRKWGLVFLFYFSERRSPLLRKLVFIFFDKKRKHFMVWFRNYFFGGGGFYFEVKVIRSRLYYEVEVVLVIKVDR